MGAEKQAPLEGATSRARRRNFGRNHAYYLQTEQGEQKLDGVTTLLGDGMRKKALEVWNCNVTAEYAVDNWDNLNLMAPSARMAALKKAPRENVDLAARRGTEIHRLAEQLLKGETVDVPDEIRGHVESAVRFLDEWKIRPVLTETTVWNERGFYAGTLDMVVTSDLLPGVVAIADWKSSRSGIYGETALQLSAYENAEYFIGDDGTDHPMADLGINEAWGVWIRSDGYTVYPMARGDEVFRTFQFVATVARRTGGADRPLDALKGEALFVPTGAAA